MLLTRNNTNSLKNIFSQEDSMKTY